MTEDEQKSVDEAVRISLQSHGEGIRNTPLKEKYSKQAIKKGEASVLPIAALPSLLQQQTFNETED
jgi:hypothetical protein